MKASSYRIARGHTGVSFPDHAIDEIGSDRFRRLFSIAACLPAERTEMENRVMAALQWLGAATEPDTMAMKIVKVATALETLVGDPSQDPRRTSGSITATLAERAAFLVGSDAKQRHDVHRRVADLYDLRSRALHRSASVNEGQLASSGNLVWSAIAGMVDLLPNLLQLDDLRTWTLTQRYAGPLSPAADKPSGERDAQPRP